MFYPVSSLYNVLNYPLEQRVMATPSLWHFQSIKTVTIDAVFRIRIFTHQSLVDYFTCPLPWIARLFREMSESRLAGRISHLTLNLLFARFPSQLLRLPDWGVLSTAINMFPRPVPLTMNITGLDEKDAAILEQDERLSELAWNGRLIMTFQ